MSSEKNSAIATAREYYDSDDADRFYYNIWGGEDIHVGLYADETVPIRTASRLTVEKMAACVDIKADTRVLDIGAGYGGSARYLASTYGCSVVCLNLSGVQNERNRARNREVGLDQKIEVIDASFDEIPLEDERFDLVWSQDAILHGPDKPKVFAEAARVLKPGGHLLFTDPMQAEGVERASLQAILDRIHLESMGSVELYRKLAAQVGLRDVELIDLSEQLPNHYASVLRDLENREDDLKARGLVSADYMERMKVGLGHWIEAGRAGRLRWGILLFQKA